MKKNPSAKPKVSKKKVEPRPPDWPYVPIPELADRLCISTATLKRHLPEMRTIKFRGRTMIHIEEVERFGKRFVGTD
jgi:hypothetical protein